MSVPRAVETLRVGASASAVSALRLEPVAVGAVTFAIGLFYWHLRAAAVSTPGYLDPWIYYALFQNFDYLYHAFYTAYYTSRLPWIIPGQVVHAVFPSVAAYFVLHVTFILAAGAAVYLLLRKFFGRTIALIGYALLLLNPIFYNAHSDDYPDGAQITYLLLAIAIALLSTESRRPILLMATSGFFAAAAIGTNLFDTFFVAALAICYLVVVSVRPRFLQLLLRDALAFGAGGILLILAVGTYAKTKGGELLFFMPSVRMARALSTANWRLPGYDWMLKEPRVLAAVFLVVIGAIVLLPWRREWRHDAALRVAAGLTVALATSTAGLSAWEFAFHGIAVFDISYYFSVFTPLLVLTAASVAGVALRRSSLGEPERRIFVVGCVLAAALPDWLIYGRRLTGWAGRTGFFLTIGFAAVAVALGVVAQRASRSGWALAIVALGAAIFFALNFSAAASITSLRFRAADSGSSSYSERIATLHLTDQLIGFMRRNHLQPTGQGAAPANFWFDAASDPAVNSIQSAYLYGWTAAGFDLPHIDAAMKALLATRRPPVLVLLCDTALCHYAPSVLRQAGYKPRVRASGLLQSGSKRLWIRAYTLGIFADEGPEVRYYRGSAGTLMRPQGVTVARWSFVGRPSGWTGATLDALAAGGPVTTSKRQWNYELVSPSLTLPAGNYRALLDGRVVRGGLDLGVLNAEKSAWISQTFYWHGQRFPPGLWMATPFQLTETTRIEIVFSNWVPWDKSSRWTLHELRLVRAR